MMDAESVQLWAKRVGRAVAVTREGSPVASMAGTIEEVAAGVVRCRDRAGTAFEFSIGEVIAAGAWRGSILIHLKPQAEPLPSTDSEAPANEDNTP